VDPELASDDRPQQGFSGGPAWSGQQADRVAGLLAEARRPDLARVRMIPAEVLRALWRGDWPPLRTAVAWPMPAARPAPGFQPDDLHVHLADRDEVASELEERLENALRRRPKRPFVAVVSGTEDQCLRGFLQRITRQIVPDCLSSATPLQTIEASWSRPPRLEGLIRAVVKERRAQLSAQEGGGACGPPHLCERLAGLDAPALLSALFYAGTDPTAMETSIGGWIHYWSRAPDLVQEPILILVGIEVPGPGPLLRGVSSLSRLTGRFRSRRARYPAHAHPLIRRLRERFASAPDVFLAPQIEDLHRNDVRQWATDTMHRQCPGLDCHRLHELAIRPFTERHRERLPMAELERPLLEALRAISRP
jgi:hypothetical protein